MAPILSFRPRTQFSLPPFELVPLEFETQAGEPLDELRNSIERHLRGARHNAPAVDAADELRHALAELRRSIG